jgi:hypothetical protein
VFEKTIEALRKHGLHLRRLEAGLLSQPWPTPDLENEALALAKDVRGAIRQIETLRETLEREGKEE